MQHTVEIETDVAAVAARLVSGWAREAVAARGTFTFAVSGGRTPWAMFERLADEDMPWESVVIFQVDERVAPAGDPDRNLTHLHDALGQAPARVVPMPVEEDDLDAAAARYGEQLPERFDLIHLGLGPDGHTASLVPGDTVLHVEDRPVALTGGLYQDRRRMTLTYPGLARAQRLLWLVTGQDKASPLELLVIGDESIPAGRVAAGASLIVADRGAAELVGLAGA